MNDAVVVSLPEGENEFQILQAKDAYSAAARLGLDVEVTDAGNSAMEQIRQLFKIINAPEPPKAIVVEPVAVDGMERLAQKAVQAGIGWFVLNCTLDSLESLRLAHPAVAVCCVGSDQIEIGRIQARQMRILLPCGGNVLYIQGPRTATAARERMQGLNEGLADARIRLIVLDGQWTEESAEQAVRGWLRLKSSEGTVIDLVAGQDDSMARGARRAFEGVPAATERFRGVPLLGIDGVPDVGQKFVASGQLTATVVMPSNVGPALDVVARWIQSGSLPPAVIRVDVHPCPADGDLRRRAALAIGGQGLER
jgi:ribose transport system substrate-binding protein